jgi:nucleotide-binding universal stress UspA family protein
MKLLIGFDGSACARAAVEDLVMAGLPAAVDATVLSVADMLIKVPYEEYMPPSEAEVGRPQSKLVMTARRLAGEAMQDARQASMEGLELVTSLFPDWKVAAETVPDSPYWALIKRAETLGANLVVVGSHGRSGLGRLFLGSVSQNVLSHAACSVRIARTHERAVARAPRILLAIDGSLSASVAADVVSERPWPPQTEVRVVTAVDPHVSMAIAYHFAFRTEHDGERDVVTAAEEAAAAVAHRLEVTGLRASTRIEMADPKRFIVAEAADWEADCIFLGARGHSRLERFTLGSVSAAVAARAGCTVEVVRP